MPTIEQIENEVWPPPDFGSHVILSCHRLRKKPIEDFTCEDLRIMIGQEIGLPLLVPNAVTVLEDNPLAQGELYPGDLLKNVTSVRSSYYCQSPELLARIVSVTKRAIALLKSSKIDADLVSQFQGFIDKHAK